MFQNPKDLWGTAFDVIPCIPFIPVTLPLVSN